MGRDAENQAKQTFDAQQAQSKKYSANSDNAYSTLMPMYTSMATNPQGFDKPTINNLTTAGMQSTGGSVAGAVGQGNLAAARTGNVGGYQFALDNAARTGIKTNADNALAVQNEDAQYKATQKGVGLSGMTGLYGSNLNAATGQTNAQNQSTQALTDAGKSGWFQNMTGLISAAGTAASGAGAIIHGPCWVAAELYGGWYAPKTIEIRAYLVTRTSLAGMAFRWFYQTFGPAWADAIKKHVTLRKVTKALFDRIYTRAVNRG
jgi:hypothetical protein